MGTSKTKLVEFLIDRDKTRSQKRGHLNLGWAEMNEAGVLASGRRAKGWMPLRGGPTWQDHYREAEEQAAAVPIHSASFQTLEAVLQ